MKLEKQLNSKNIQSTGTVTAMKLDEDAHSTIFEIFTSGLYSDPIGSIIREITSNCFDSHVEAKKNNPKNPVVVKITNEVSGMFISFIDKGVGMSPDRVHNIYGTYFKSTKNETNDQIGGFGLGGKTPLAYTESFFLITRFESVEYIYNIFMGNDSPMVELMSQESTKKVNGSEVKIPIKPNDLNEFEKKTLRQLYYFENIVFEGFSDSHVTNDYTITKGKTFLYRGNKYTNKMHVCLGKVAYPINFEALDVDEYDYDLPVAINIEIGELDNGGVTRSREELKYTDANKKIILKKMDDVKVELIELLAKQYDNVQTMKQYYDVIDNLGTLNLGNKILNIADVKKNDVDFPNFKYDNLKMPSFDNLITTFYNNKTFGKKQSTRYWNRNYKNNFNSMKEFDNVYYVDDDFKRVVLKQSYLQYLDDRFFIHTPKKFTNEGMITLKRELGLTTTKEIPFTKKEITARKKAHEKSGLDLEYFDDNLFKIKVINLIPKAKGENLIAELIKDVHLMMANGAKNYDDLVVPDDYIAIRKANRMSPNILKTGIPVKDIGNYGYRSKLTMETLVNLRGKIYYGFTEDSYNLNNSSRIFSEISGSEKCATVSRYGDVKNKGTMFIQISKSNEKYLKMLGRKAIHIDYFYQTYVARKIDMIFENKSNEKAEALFNDNVLPVFHKDNVFNHIDKEIFNMATKIYNDLDSHRKFYHINDDKVLSKLHIDLSNVQIEFKHKEELEYLTMITDGCRDRLEWINFPYEIDLKNKADKELIELVNLCIDK